MRKDINFEVMDRIKVGITGNEKLAAIVTKNKDAIATKVLAEVISTTDTFANAKNWNVNGEEVTISVEKN